MSKRSSSSKLFFYDLHGDGAKVQVMADARYITMFYHRTCMFLFLFLQISSYIPSPSDFSFGQAIENANRGYSSKSNYLHQEPQREDQKRRYHYPPKSLLFLSNFVWLRRNRRKIRQTRSYLNPLLNLSPSSCICKMESICSFGV